MLLDLKMNMLLCLKMFPANYAQKKKKITSNLVQGEEACTDLPVSRTPFEMENSPSSSYPFLREGSGGGGKEEEGPEVWTREYLDLTLAGVSRHLFCMLASFKVLTVTRSLLFSLHFECHNVALM